MAQIWRTGGTLIALKWRKGVVLMAPFIELYLVYFHWKIDNNIDIFINRQYYNSNVITIFDNNKLTQQFLSIENIRYDNKIDVN